MYADNNDIVIAGYSTTRPSHAYTIAIVSIARAARQDTMQCPTHRSLYVVIFITIPHIEEQDPKDARPRLLLLLQLEVRATVG